MSAAAAKTTRIFGLKVNADPKFLLGGLIALLVLALWWNLHNSGGEGGSSSSGTVAPVASTVPGQPSAAPLVKTGNRSVRRNAGAAADRGLLRIRPVDASDGRIDPTLRTDLLARLQTVEPLQPGRSLFQAGAASTADGRPVKIMGPKVPVNVPLIAPQRTVPSAPPQPQVNIPLRYYGFVNPASKQEAARGLFMDGENILVAKEGDQLMGRYLVVALNANQARMEDTQIRQGELLPVAPQANELQ